MTRSFNEKARCVCGREITLETDFERWVRNCPALDSVREGIVRFDLDLLLHKYKTHEDGKGSREVQHLMFIEVKTNMASPSAAQTDTLSMLNQVLRNRRPNVNSRNRFQAELAPVKVKSKMLGKMVTLKMYGGHLLQFDGTDPTNSTQMKWDGKDIDPSWLVDLLTFVRDPDRPKLKMDHRRRSRPWNKLPQTLLKLEA